MSSLLSPLYRFWLILALFVTSGGWGWAAGPNVQILSPQNGARISQDQNLLLLSGKVASGRARSANVDIFLLTCLSALLIMRALISRTSWIFLLCIISPGIGSSRPQVSIFGAGINIGSGEAPRYNLRNSIFAAEIIASRRMLSQLDA
jgi:hypothetical protein